MEGRNLAKNFFTNGQENAPSRLSSADVVGNKNHISSARSSDLPHFKGSTSNSIISMIDSTLQSDRVVVPATHEKHKNDKNSQNGQNDQKQTTKIRKNDCYTGNHHYKPTLANYRHTGGNNTGGSNFLPRQVTKPNTSKYSKTSKTSSSALAKYLNVDKKRAEAAKGPVAEKKPSKYRNSMVGSKLGSGNEKDMKKPVEAVLSKYEIYARKRENSKIIGNVVLSKKAKIKTEKYEKKSEQKQPEQTETEQAKLQDKIQEIQQTRIAVQQQNNENTENGEEILTVDSLVPVKSEKKGKKFMLKKFLKDVDTFSSGGSEGAPSEFDAASVKSDGSGDHRENNQKTEDYVPGEGLKTSFNC